MAIERPLEACTRDEVRYLLDLAREHVGHVRLRVRERADRLEILLEADSPELSRYFSYMLDRERARGHGAGARPKGGKACASRS